MLSNRAHEGLQPPSNLEERKRLKEAQRTAHVRSAAHPHPSLGPAGCAPPRSRAPRRSPRPRPASPPRSRVASLPSRERIVSASLKATLRRKGQTVLPLTRPPYGGINANHSSTAPGLDGVRPPFPTVAVTGVSSANSGHCSAIPDAVATLWEPATWCKTCSALLQLLYCQLPIPPSYFPFRGALERHGHDPRKRLRP